MRKKESEPESIKGYQQPTWESGLDAGLTSFMNPDLLGMLQSFPSPSHTPPHSRASQKHGANPAKGGVFPKIFYLNAALKLLCASRQPRGSNARGATSTGFLSPLAPIPMGSCWPFQSCLTSSKSRHRKGAPNLLRSLLKGYKNPP